jgi:type I restriction enzyme S subunit
MKGKNLKPGWEMVKFGEVVRNVNLVEREIGKSGTERIVGLEHIYPEDLHIRRWNTPDNGTSFTRKFVPGQTLFGKRRAYQRKVAFAEFEGICSGDILTFESKDKKALLPELLPFICQSDAFFDHALGTSAGSLSPRTSWKALKVFEFALPPIEEQKRIAEILWNADEVTEKWNKIIKEIEYLINLIRHSHFKSINTANHQPLGNLTEIVTKGESPRWQGYEYQEKGALFVTSENVLFGEYKGEPVKYIPYDFHNKLRRSQLQHNDVLVNLVGASIGRACVYRSFKDANINQAVALIRCNKKDLLPDYLLSFLLSPVTIKNLIGESVNTARANLSLTQLRNLQIPQISIKEQERFCFMLVKPTKVIETIRSHIQMLSVVSKSISNGIVYV